MAMLWLNPDGRHTISRLTLRYSGIIDSKTEYMYRYGELIMAQISKRNQIRICDCIQDPRHTRIYQTSLVFQHLGRVQPPIRSQTWITHGLSQGRRLSLPFHSEIIEAIATAVDEEENGTNGVFPDLDIFQGNLHALKVLIQFHLFPTRKWKYY